MKILFISKEDEIDFLGDMLFLGLKEMSNIEVYSNSRMAPLYKGNSKSFLDNLWGKGFTLYNKLEGENDFFQKEEEIQEKIKNKWYDLVIFGVIEKESPFLELVIKIYEQNRIIFIDGSDSDFSAKTIKYVRYFAKHPLLYRKRCQQAKDDLKKAYYLRTKGFYFKRELPDHYRNDFYPISFAIQESLIVDKIPLKKKEKAFIIPGDQSTYIYKTEEAYYKDYQESLYGMTIEKGGWDCLRHYEILANACIPYFPKLENCPKSTMWNFPKSIILETNRLIEQGNMDKEKADFFMKMLLSYTKDFLTTKKLAEYILSFI